ncbi:hypothetical protein BGLA2_1080015 [Burkholderia gladioli]|nr:hypothetical protein BGLA2_1080015 [Burkholderia gladioli]
MRLQQVRRSGMQWAGLSQQLFVSLFCILFSKRKLDLIRSACKSITLLQSCF